MFNIYIYITDTRNNIENLSHNIYLFLFEIHNSEFIQFSFSIIKI